MSASAGTGGARSGQRIVVGLDDDPVARHALQWAVAEAVLRDARLEVVHAWQPVVPLEPTGLVSPPANYDLDAAARQRAVEIVDEVRAGATGWPPDVTVDVIEGPAGPILVEQADGAAMLVVGSRGHRALAEVVLGSVSRHCTHHASCPVVVVRPAR